MRSPQRSFVPVRSIAALVLLGIIACTAIGCGPYYGDGFGYGYPAYGYAPPLWGGWGYSPSFVVHHPWEEHYYGGGHHTFFYDGGGGFHGGHGGGGFYGGGHGDGRH